MGKDGKKNQREVPSMHFRTGRATGGYVDFHGERFYRIADYDAMPPFFMSVVSASDHWLFVSSTGGLTAGRVDPDHALFPYETDDKIADAAATAGPATVIRVGGGADARLWEPFERKPYGPYRLERNLYKNLPGTALAFEEINRDLALGFSYTWRTSDRFGLVRICRLRNLGAQSRTVNVIDGLRNILPSGADTGTQSSLSCLLDAYKRSELMADVGLGLFALNAKLSDMAEPSESLRTNVVWQVGLHPTAVGLSERRLDDFRRGEAFPSDLEVRGERGAYLAAAELELAAGGESVWRLVADVDKDAVEVLELAARLRGPADGLAAALDADIVAGDRKLVDYVGSADGGQLTGDAVASAHHFSNVLFNVMRGGIFPYGYELESADFRRFVQGRNAPLAAARTAFFDALPATVRIADLTAKAAASGDGDLARLSREYLPLGFGRRHGDPSRPWNRFAIRIRDERGGPKLDYQGNWRDIFQNWEPLAFAFPRFLPSMIARFLNTTTADGYNPYHLTRDGFAWEIPEAGNPWANIGYWSDHQIIYLLKLMEALEKLDPGALAEELGERVYSHADVPYRIKPYAAMLQDWSATIGFDREAQARVDERVKAIGGDGKLVHDAAGKLHLVTAAEKLLILMLAKIANLVPAGGIWMNTQRPEWNDANNALVGKGLSVVTACYLRRYANFCADLFAGLGTAKIVVAAETAEWLAAASAALGAFAGRDAADEAGRRAFMDAINPPAERYRETIYRQGPSGRFVDLAAADLAAFFRRTLEPIDAAVRANRRSDGLYHAYNVMSLTAGGVAVRNLAEMLEGQVAVLSSGLLAPAEAADLLRALRASPLYRADQHSYLLYPDRRLPTFVGRNTVPSARLEPNRLAVALAAADDRTVLRRDAAGDWHFAGSFRNVRDLRAALAKLAAGEAYAPLVPACRADLEAAFEETFDHASFTGRSGTFFAYEGLGSIYWHMIAKLLLAAQENFFAAAAAGAPEAAALADAYYDLRAGLGFNKGPAQYGAFPTDPYSHTPGGKGARQPGMTGQVKEEVLTRFGELGVSVAAGRVRFEPKLLRAEEFLAATAEFPYTALDGQRKTLALAAGQLAFTWCQVPVVYERAARPAIEIVYADATRRVHEGVELPAAASAALFDRDGSIVRLDVKVAEVLG
jgi:hypothetical protein